MTMHGALTIVALTMLSACRVADERERSPNGGVILPPDASVAELDAQWKEEDRKADGCAFDFHGAHEFHRVSRKHREAAMEQRRADSIEYVRHCVAKINGIE